MSAPLVPSCWLLIRLPQGTCQRLGSRAPRNDRLEKFSEVQQSKETMKSACLYGCSD